MPHFPCYFLQRLISIFSNKHGDSPSVHHIKSILSYIWCSTVYLYSPIENSELQKQNTP